MYVNFFFFSIHFEYLDSKQILVFECHISMAASLIMHKFFFSFWQNQFVLDLECGSHIQTHSMQPQ